MKFNANNYVQVKLTALGKIIYYKYEIHCAEKIPGYKIVPCPDVLELPLWELMQIYGSYVSMTQHPFETDMELVGL